MIRHHNTTFSYKPQCSLQCSTVDQPVMDHFAQMKTMLSSFLGPRQETTRTAFCNYLASEVEALEERDFQIFRNEAVKLLSGIQCRPEERTHQPQQPSLFRSFSATSTYVPLTFQQLQQPAPAGQEYILTIPETQMPASLVKFSRAKWHLEGSQLPS